MTAAELREKVADILSTGIEGADDWHEAVDAILRLIDEERDAARREAYENAAKVCDEAAADADRVANQMCGLDWPHSATAMAAIRDALIAVRDAATARERERCANILRRSADHSETMARKYSTGAVKSMWEDRALIVAGLLDDVRLP